MSFSSKVKDEILNINFNHNKHCYIAELSAILNYISKIIRRNGQTYLVISSENQKLIKRCQKIIYFTFNFNVNISFENNKLFSIIITDYNIINTFFTAINQNIDLEENFNTKILNNTCCKRAYIKGSFLCNGYISEPEKSYHLEFTNLSFCQAEDLKQLLLSFQIFAKSIEKKNYFIVYIKEAEQIVNLLNIIEAHKALLEFENIRIVKDLRNNINRIVNCEAANLNKIISNSVKQKQDILFIQKKIGLNSIPTQLSQVAKLRLKYPEASLKELGEMLSPPISKSGVNHRMKKIKKIADSLLEN